MKTLAVALIAIGATATPTISLPATASQAAPRALGGTGGDVKVSHSNWDVSEISGTVRSKKESSGRVIDSNGRLVGMWKRLEDNTSGSVKIPDDQFATAGISLASYNADTGGGDWRHGTYKDSNGYKHCWSFYYHGKVKHSATADMSSAYWGLSLKETVVGTAGADAQAEPGPAKLAGTCYVYWNNNVK